ncbi:MAG: TetR/AcrR family transcriptional regulator [Actinobacteria bacterium]|nr:TetR/AcrR family transcriptional regulator [Actinomycetota bacterium]
MVKPGDQDTSRKDRILRAAGELIAEVGWANVTTRLISKRAGVNNALIHYYFGTKDDLLLEAASAVFAAEIEGSLAVIEEAESFAEVLEGVFTWLRTVDVHSPLMVISMEAIHQAVRDERVGAWIRGVWGEYFDVLAGAVAAGQERGEIPSYVDPNGFAVMLGALIDGLSLYRLVELDFDIEKTAGVIDALVEALTKGTQ